jgi:hypothetical protein
MSHKNLYILSGIISVLWLLLLWPLMITDVWDETNILLAVAAEPLASAGMLDITGIIWAHQLPLDIYRPLALTLEILLIQLTDGNMVLLRYLNALMILGAVCMLMHVLLRRAPGQTGRAAALGSILLFSGSALITAGWFANVFDATCLLLICAALALYQHKRFVLAGAALALAAFCKEIYVLALPVLLLFFYLDRQQLHKSDMLTLLGIALAGSVLYWTLRLNMIALGSQGDIHGFSPQAFLGSSLSFTAGFLYQFSKFSLFNGTFWAGLLGLLAVFASLRDGRVLLCLLVLLALSALIYWGMFSYQGAVLVTSANFIGRLYLVPFALFVLFVCLQARPIAIGIVAIASLWGMVGTYADHLAFQRLYAELYERAQNSPEQLIVHYPEKPLTDTARNITIGDYPQATVQVDVVSAAMVERPR